ncbi:MAG: leucine-rich repeat domain-containing protein, partial [Clostridia bacterium]
MSRKGKIFFTIMQACLIVTIMMIGVFSLMSKSFTISNQISFTAVDVAATVSVVVTKNLKGGTPISATIAGMADGTFNIDATNKDTTERIVSASDLTFNGSGIENSIDYKVMIKNNGSRIIKVNFDVTTLTANLQANGITATKIDGGPIAENATGTYVFKMVLGTKAIDVPKIEIKLPFNLSVLTPNQVSDFTYSKIDAGTHIEITGYSGASPMVVFPETIENLPVTSIGANAFSGNTAIKGVFFPNGLTKICDNAFSNCSGIVDSLIFPNSVTSIGDSAFYGCSGVTGALT